MVKFARAQLDNKHWIPPMVAQQDQGSYNEYIYLSTPIEESFIVTIKDGSNNIIVETLLSKASPQEILIPRFGENAGKTLINWPELGEIFKDKGLVLEGKNDFYVNYRAEGEPHAGSFVTKGRAGLGMSFRTAHLFTAPIPATGNGRLNFISFMTTENNTTVTISDIRTGVEIAGSNELITGPFSVELPDVGDTYIMGVFSGGGTRQQENELMGALITSDKPIVVNCGSWISSPGAGNHNDVGIEQIFPLGKR